MLDAPIAANTSCWARMASKNGTSSCQDGYRILHIECIFMGDLSLMCNSGGRTIFGSYRPLVIFNHDSKLARFAGHPQIQYPDQCVVLLNFAKAFDSVPWATFDIVLHHFAFGTTFGRERRRSTVKQLYVFC